MMSWMPQGFWLSLAAGCRGAGIPGAGTVTVSVSLLALAWPTHVHLALQPAVVKIPILFGDVMQALAQMTANGVD